ncbi:MAG TPA: NUDIX hydrolase [Candidatus Baltobacteraceae bacterium]|nr:NUDIX hydrolase [Candidatus Baltobacteraceae bacterium]
MRRRRTVAYQNDWLVVWHDEVTRPDGQPGIYGVVHPRNLAVGIVTVDEAGRVLLVGQYRYTLDRYSWEIPEGGAPQDEAPLLGAQRELAEETGYRATLWREMGTLHTSNSLMDEAGILYMASGLVPGPAEPDPTEELDQRWVSLTEALEMVERGEITDALSIIGLQRLALERTGG